MRYKLAVATPDGNRVAEDIRQADYFVVFDIARGRVTGWEVRDRSDHVPSGRRTSLPVECFKDCRYLIAGGLGETAESLCMRNGTDLLSTNIETVTEALEAYFDGMLMGREAFETPHPRA
ncbi:hypothetical protein GF324_08310 [bacterium]|nr:hypothetical protein [bacterium]